MLNNQRGVIHLFILILLLLGIAVGVYLITAGPLKLFPKASSTPVDGPATGFIFSPNLSSIKVGDKLSVKLLVRSDIEETNLYDAKISFNKDVLAVETIDYSTSFVKNWVEQYSDNTTGTVSLVGGVPNPGVKTSQSSTPLVMAVINFNVLKTATATLSFTDTSAVYSNITNLNILNLKEGVSLPASGSTPSPTPAGPSVSVSPVSVVPGANLTVSWSGIPQPHYRDALYMYRATDNVNVGGPYFVNNNCTSAFSATNSVVSSGQCVIKALTTSNGFGNIYFRLYSTNGTEFPTVILASSNQVNVFADSIVTPSPSPVSTPVPGTGDGNNDGKINLVDLSVLLSDFNKTGNVRNGIDMNGDRVINTFDFSLMRNLLISKGVIKG